MAALCGSAQARGPTLASGASGVSSDGATRERARGVERGVDRLLARAVADHHVDLEVAAAAVTRATAPRPAKHSNVPRRSFSPDSGRKSSRRRSSRQPITTTTAPSGDAVGRDLAVAVDRADAVGADHEQGPRIVVRRLWRRLDLDQPSGKSISTPLPRALSPVAAVLAAATTPTASAVATMTDPVRSPLICRPAHRTRFHPEGKREKPRTGRKSQNLRKPALDRRRLSTKSPPGSLAMTHARSRVRPVNPPAPSRVGH